MPSLAQSILLVALYVVWPGVPFAPIQALASPVPMPLPLMTVDYSRHNATTFRTSDSRTKHSFAHNRTLPFPMTSKPISARDINELLVSLTGFYNGASNHAANYKVLAEKSSLIDDHDYDFQHACAYELTGFQTSLAGFQSCLEGDKGLANYDRSDELETMLKNLVNLNKDVLKCTDVLVYNIPVLGPILGPIVYKIKCILEDLLNLIENLTDAIINVTILLLLRPLISRVCQGLLQCL